MDEEKLMAVFKLLSMCNSSELRMVMDRVRIVLELREAVGKGPTWPKDEGDSSPF
jgi:hypothetical protein